MDFTFVKVDSWDGESAYFYLDYELKWSESLSNTNGVHTCGSSSAGSSWKEEYKEKSFTVSHFAPYVA